MTIKHRKHEQTGAKLHVLECDTCGDQLESDQGDPWHVFWRYAKDRGWTTRKVENKFNNWIHACAECPLKEPLT